MAYPYTSNGYNMFDMLSQVQKAIRRGDYEHAAFAAEQLKTTYRATLWNRLIVITSEDCFGVLTKEVVELKKQDDAYPDDKNIGEAIALMCRAKKSRDACYFACNFILANRKTQNFSFTYKAISDFYARLSDLEAKMKIKKAKPVDTPKYDQFGFFIEANDSSPDESDECEGLPDCEKEVAYNGLAMQKAIAHRDMDMIGFHANYFREKCRSRFWPVIFDYAEEHTKPLLDEIRALKYADDTVNKRKKPLEKDNIFMAKAILLICYYQDEYFETVLSSDVVKYDTLMDWSKTRVKPISECVLVNGEIPEWVYDCHTLKGKKMGKTDWDMTVSEQAALTPLQLAYFDEASWIYTYEQDAETGVLNDEGMKPIRKFAETHSANPVVPIPYEQ